MNENDLNIQIQRLQAQNEKLSTVVGTQANYIAELEVTNEMLLSQIQNNDEQEAQG
ncbi:phage protein [Staphylococcus aureus]|nr:phage protein [Staphylococcus aureus]